MLSWYSVSILAIATVSKLEFYRRSGWHMNNKLQKCVFSWLNRFTFNFSSWGRDAAAAAALSRVQPLVVFTAFLATQPCNLVVLGVIIPSLFIVIVSLALWLACRLAGILKSNRSVWNGLGWYYHWHWFLSAALHFFLPYQAVWCEVR